MPAGGGWRSEEHTSELQSLTNLVCRLLLEKKKNKIKVIASVKKMEATKQPAVTTAACRAVSAASSVRLAPAFRASLSFAFVFFFNDTATTEIYTLSLHDALPI